MYNYGIYAIGAALVDTEIQIDDSDLKTLNIDKGVMTLVDEERQKFLLEQLSHKLVAAERACGGSAANSIIAAQYFGSQTFFSCQVANDEHGNFYADDLIKAGVHTQAQEQAQQGTTGKCLVFITPDAERTMNTHLGISERISTANIHQPAIDASRFVYIEGYLVTSATGKPAAIKTRELAKAAGAKVALSLSDPAIVKYFREGLLEMVGAGVDIIFCNENEAMNFTLTQSIEEAAEALKTYCNSFAITCGARPTWVYDGTSVHQVHANPAKAIDTNGAGDMFAGAFLAALDQGKTYLDAAAFANRAAAKIVAQFGPRLKAEQYAELKSAL